jgi:hypothetical protein
MTDNLKLWDSVKRVPPEHLKPFTRGGGFRGTAIKPMWSIHKMTEEFGPCGVRWGIESPIFNVIQAADEILVFCTVELWISDATDEGPMYLHGVGGDKVLSKTKDGLRADDEAYKKAYTDAIGNALKFLGVGADIHMGLWDGSKYVDDNKTSVNAPVDNLIVMGSVNGTPGASKASHRIDYDNIVKAIRNSSSAIALSELYHRNSKLIDELPPDWVDELRIEYLDKTKELKKELKV